MSEQETVDVGEVFESLTGFDEIAISKVFNVEIADLEQKPFVFMRSMVFILRRREGMKDTEAYKAAMDMTVGQLSDMFPEPEVEIDPDDPETETGKGESEPA